MTYKYYVVRITAHKTMREFIVLFSDYLSLVEYKIERGVSLGVKCIKFSIYTNKKMAISKWGWGGGGGGGLIFTKKNLTNIYGKKSYHLVY